LVHLETAGSPLELEIEVAVAQATAYFARVGRDAQVERALVSVELDAKPVRGGNRKIVESPKAPPVLVGKRRSRPGAKRLVLFLRSPVRRPREAPKILRRLGRAPGEDPRHQDLRKEALRTVHAGKTITALGHCFFRTLN